MEEEGEAETAGRNIKRIVELAVRIVRRKRSRKERGCKEEVKLIERDLRLEIYSFGISETERV